MRCQFIRRIPEMVLNLNDIYRNALAVDVTLGEVWYPNARRIVSEWSDTYRFSETTVACVIAAISPQVPWTRNLIIADDILAGRPPSIGAIRANVAKAVRIRDSYRNGLTPIETMRHFMPFGPKVAHFAENLSGNDALVTVDTHAMQAALDDVTATYTLGWTPYLVFAGAYTLAARQVNRSPAEFQAIIWHAWKRRYPPEVKRNHRRQWEVIGMEGEE